MIRSRFMLQLILSVVVFMRLSRFGAAVSTSSVDMKSPKWYVVNKIGMATLCKNFKDAKKEACEADTLWPRNGPHLAVQLVNAKEALNLRKLCAVMYQAAGAYNMPERFLDALSAAANGEAYDKSFTSPIRNASRLGA